MDVSLTFFLSRWISGDVSLMVEDRSRLVESSTIEKAGDNFAAR